MVLGSRRASQDAELGAPAVFLARDESSATTGQAILAACGTHMWGKRQGKREGGPSGVIKAAIFIQRCKDLTREQFKEY